MRSATGSRDAAGHVIDAGAPADLVNGTPARGDPFSMPDPPARCWTRSPALLVREVTALSAQTPCSATAASSPTSVPRLVRWRRCRPTWPSPPRLENALLGLLNAIRRSRRRLFAHCELIVGRDDNHGGTLVRANQLMNRDPLG